MNIYDSSLKNDNINLHICRGNISYEHDHNFLELAYVFEGKIKSVINNQEQILKTGDYFIIDYKSRHSYKLHQCKSIAVINCLFLPSFIDKTLVYCNSFNVLLNHYLLKIRNDSLQHDMGNFIYHDNNEEILTILKAMLEEFENKDFGYLELIRSKLIEILIKTARLGGTEKSKINFDEPWIYIINNIRDNYMKHLTLGDYAKKMNYSVPYLSKLFSEHLGVGYGEYLQRVRAQEACRLLCNTKKKITEIAGDVGYEDVNFFFKVFKKNIGMSPGKFRSLMQQKDTNET